MALPPIPVDLVPGGDAAPHWAPSAGSRVTSYSAQGGRVDIHVSPASPEGVVVVSATAITAYCYSEDGRAWHFKGTPGTSTGWVESGASLVQSVDIDFYVDPVGGDNSNTGRTRGAPIQTWDHLVDQVARIVDEFVTVTIHLFRGSHVPTKPLVLVANFGRVVIIGDGDGASDGDISANVTTVSTGTVTGAGNTTGRMVMAGGLTEDAHLGLTWRATSGAAAGYRRTVAYNTTNTYHFPIGLESAPVAVSNGDTYAVEHSDVYLDFPADNLDRPFIVQNSAPPLDLAGTSQAAATLVNLGLRATASTGTFASPVFQGGLVQMYGVHVDRSASYLYVKLKACHMSAGLDSFDSRAYVPEALGLAADSYAWRAWGLGKAPTGAGTYGSWWYGDEHSSATLYGVADALNAGTLRFWGGTLWEQQGFGSVTVGERERADYRGYGFSGKCCRLRAESGPALRVLGECYGLDRPMLHAVSGDAIEVGGKGSLDYYSGPDDLQDPIATGLGMKVLAGGRVRYTPFWNDALLGGTTGWEIDGFPIDPQDRGDGSPYPAGTRIEFGAGALLEVY